MVQYMDYIRALGFSNPSRMKFLFLENSLPSAQDPAMRIALLVGHAKYDSMEGRFVAARQHYEKALNYTRLKSIPTLSARDRDNLLAYIHFEYADFCKLVHADELALSHYQQARVLSASPRMNLIIQYQFALQRLFAGEDGALAEIGGFIDSFREYSMPVMECIALMRLGNYHSDRGQVKEAGQFYSEAYGLAVERNYLYLQWNINNSLGLLYVAEGDPQKALEHYARVLSETESPYFKTLMLKNMAIQFHQTGDNEQCLDCLKQALDIAQVNGISSQISILAGMIGDLYRLELGQKTHAFHYYKIAFAEVIELANHGIPITGKRLKIIEKYHALIQENLPPDFMALKEPGLFEWSRGKTWVQIKDLFHYNLFVYHFLHTGIGNLTFSQLKINAGTFYSLSKRMRDLRGITIPDLRGVDFELPPELYLEPLQKYVQLHRDLSWEGVNAQFEKDIFAWLFEESGYNKLRLAKMLDRSYAMVIKDTRHLTEVAGSPASSISPGE